MAPLPSDPLQSSFYLGGTHAQRRSGVWRDRWHFAGDGLAPACRLKLTFFTGAWWGTFAWVICPGRVDPPMTYPQGCANVHGRDRDGYRLVDCELD
jgi:hypothetical protein